MLVGYARPSDPAITIAGTGASIDSDAALFFDGYPGTDVRCTWLSGAQTTSSRLDFTITWTAPSAIRAVAVLNTTLPEGTLMRLRHPDGVGGYTVDPGGNSDQRIVTTARAERMVWFLAPQPATGITGLQVQIFNDVDGAATIPADSEFTIGEIVMFPLVTLPLEREWEVSPVDPSQYRRSIGQQLHTVSRDVYDRLDGRLVPTHVDEVKRQALANGQDWTTLRAALEGGARGCCLPRWSDGAGAVDPVVLHDNALYGYSPPSSIQHRGGNYFQGAWVFEAIP